MLGPATDHAWRPKRSPGSRTQRKGDNKYDGHQQPSAPAGQCDELAELRPAVATVNPAYPLLQILLDLEASKGAHG